MAAGRPAGIFSHRPPLSTPYRQAARHTTLSPCPTLQRARSSQNGRFRPLPLAAATSSRATLAPVPARAPSRRSAPPSSLVKPLSTARAQEERPPLRAVPATVSEPARAPA
jgi:hypothetical protein